MSYIIIAEIQTSLEENITGDKTLVNASILAEQENYIKFDIKGDFFKQREFTKELCNSIIDAGFISFSISHSY